MGYRRGFSLIELVTVVAVFAILLGLLVPAIQRAREEARRTACSDNLRAIGVALGGYHDVHGMWPPVQAAANSLDIPISPHAALLPFAFSPESPIAYDLSIVWSKQTVAVATNLVPIFLCPSRAHPEVVQSPSMALLNLPVGSEFATTDYILSKGPNDSWCLPDGSRKFKPTGEDDRGAFGLGQVTRLNDIADGLGTTIVMGEGASGPHWQTTTRKNIRAPYRHKSTGEVAESYNFWICPRINTTKDQDALGLVMTSLYGTTAVPMNDQYIMETLAEVHALDDCRSSSDGGPHRVSGFRSEHPAGGLFLFADGSVHFLHADLDTKLYRGFSTIHGEESIHFGN